MIPTNEEKINTVRFRILDLRRQGQQFIKMANDCESELNAIITKENIRLKKSRPRNKLLWFGIICMAAGGIVSVIINLGVK